MWALLPLLPLAISIEGTAFSDHSGETYLLHNDFLPLLCSTENSIRSVCCVFFAKTRQYHHYRKFDFFPERYARKLAFSLLSPLPEFLCFEFLCANGKAIADFSKEINHYSLVLKGVTLLEVIQV